jgi:hypothetical protein
VAAAPAGLFIVAGADAAAERPPPGEPVMLGSTVEPGPTTVGVGEPGALASVMGTDVTFVGAARTPLGELLVPV